MSKSPINPFRPRAFPPQHLNKKRIAKLLKRAHCSLEEFAMTLPAASKQSLSYLLKKDALDSLESQNTGVSLKELLHAKKNERKTAPIIDYLEAMDWASQNIVKAPFSKRQICKIHRIIKRSSSSKSELGKYRKRQNWIGPAGCTIDEAYFYPPKVENVGKMMDQLIKYMNRKTKDPLLQLALIFAQLLIIHPFMDGNGRIARCLVPLFLYKQKVVPIPFFPLSTYFKTHKLRYYLTLYQTTEDENWESWITFFLKGIIQSSKKSLRLLKK